MANTQLIAADEAIERVLSDPSTSHWLQNVLRAAIQRDACDAYNDAALLARLLDNRLRALIADWVKV